MRAIALNDSVRQALGIQVERIDSQTEKGRKAMKMKKKSTKEVRQWDSSHGIMKPRAASKPAEWYYPIFEHGDGGLLVATIHGRNEDEIVSRAQLVGAVPELLAACKFALSVLKANPVEMSERMAIEKLS